MRYVFPVPRELRGALLSHSRLYAFPVEPEPPPDGGFVILDSGAFGLASAGARMDDAYIARLAAHYARHEGERVLCVAPDEYPNPARTMRNFVTWRGVPVVPVLQSSRRGRLDAYAMLRQARLYGQSSHKIAHYEDRPVVAISNPALFARDLPARAWQNVCAMIRQHIPDAWIHLLGAGWNVDDIRAWAEMECFDSLDSIAYYIAAQSFEAWSHMPATPACWQDVALHNALAALDAATLP